MDGLQQTLPAIRVASVLGDKEPDWLPCLPCQLGKPGQLLLLIFEFGVDAESAVIEVGECGANAHHLVDVGIPTWHEATIQFLVRIGQRSGEPESAGSERFFGQHLHLVDILSGCRF